MFDRNLWNLGSVFHWVRHCNSCINLIFGPCSFPSKVFVRARTADPKCFAIAHRMSYFRLDTGNVFKLKLYHILLCLWESQLILHPPLSSFKSWTPYLAASFAPPTRMAEEFSNFMLLLTCIDENGMRMDGKLNTSLSGSIRRRSSEETKQCCVVFFVDEISWVTENDWNSI